MPLTHQWVAQQKMRLGELRSSGTYVCWTQKNRINDNKYVNQLYCYHNDSITCVSPSEHCVASKIHTYGGGGFWLNSHSVWYINRINNQLYCYEFKTKQLKKIPIQTDYQTTWIFSDGQITQSGDCICVAEQHNKTSINYALVWIHKQTGIVDILHDQYDFYAYPRLNQSETQLCWISWQYLSMPWQASQLYISDLNTLNRTLTIKNSLSAANTSYSQPVWHQNSIIYLHDGNGFSNLYRYHNGSETPLYESPKDMGEPLWQLAVSTFHLLDQKNLVIRCQDTTQEQLIHLDLTTLKTSKLLTPNSHFQPYLAGYDQKLFCIFSQETKLPSLGFINTETHTTKTLVDFNENDSQQWSRANLITIDSQNRKIFAFFYEPKSFVGIRPPLIVNCHSGPTAGLTCALKPEIQYWCQLGYAVLDVAYSGTTGFGRAYQKRLDGQFGLLDSIDCINATQYLIDQKKIDASRITIRGKSSGGLTALNACIYSNLYAAAIVYYGITDLVKLAQHTHPFESGYLTSLVGHQDQASRSPIHHIHDINSHLLLLYGDQDPVVPKSQSERFIQALKAQGKEVTSKCYVGEGHGFSNPENRADALEQERLFLIKQL